MQARGTTSVKRRSARKAVRLAARQTMIKGNTESGLSSTSSSVGISTGERTRRRRKVESRDESRYEKVVDDESTIAGCREPHIGFSSVRPVDGSLDSDSPDRTVASETYSTENVSIAVIEMKSSTTWQEHISAKQN